MDPSAASEANLALWDRFPHERAAKYPSEELVRFIARTFPDRAKRTRLSLLELGCGAGPNLWLCLREGFVVAGIDFSSSAISSARHRLRSEESMLVDPDADLRVGNFANLPWSDQCFDVVIDIEAIYANVTVVIYSTIIEVARVLKPGGWFFGKMFGTKTTGISTGVMLEDRTSQNPTEGVLQGLGIAHAFTEEELRKMFVDFAEVKIDWLYRSDRGQSQEVFEWLVQARR